MLKPLSLVGALLVTSALTVPAALAQTQSTTPTPASPTTSSAPPLPTDDLGTPQDDTDEGVDISIPGANAPIVVTGRRNADPVRSSDQVVSVLSTADIARTGEGDIAGALQRVSGLSVVGNGFVYVRGLGDRYSLALLNGLPLPSPEPLKRVVPLDIFPTNVIASSYVQKSFSANFPGEFGGGVINLTTTAIPREPFLSIGGSISGDSETTGYTGYTYYGSPSDWTGFDNGTRDIPGPLQQAFNSGHPILEGANFSRSDLQNIASSLVNARTTLLQKNSDIPANFSGDISGGTGWDIGSARLGVIASAGIKNDWRTRQTLQQNSLNADLSGTPQSSYDRVITDNHVVVNGLFGMGLEFGQSKIRWTNLYIRDTLKQARLGLGTDANQFGRDIMKQDTAWYERQLFDTQLVGEFDLGPVQLDLRGSYANSQREAPYERSFTYVRTNNANDPTGEKFVNDLGGNKGDATIAFSDLNEDVYAGGADLSYEIAPRLTLSGGYAYTENERTSTRRAFQYRASGLPIPVQQLRPDYLLSDYTIQTYGITLLETSAQDGTAAFDASLKVHAGYAQIAAGLSDAFDVTAGVRYETGKQRVMPIDLFNTGSSAIVATDIDKDYWLPTLTATWKITPDTQLRLSGSKTIARPQFRELVAQVFQDPESNRQFRGNPSLQDSELWNAEARFEWYLSRDEQFNLAAFYKKIDNPIETFTSQSDTQINSSFANAPSADLYGAEVSLVKFFPTADWFSGDFFASRRVRLEANYTYTQSKLKVGADDTTIVNGGVSAASDFFRDGSPLTGQSDHLANLQLGLEDQDKLSQQTLLLTYATPRVTSRGPSGQPDIKEHPGFHLDFVAREGIPVFGIPAEFKFEVRNITGQKYKEYQQAGDNRIYYNLYDVGTSVSFGAGLRF